MKIHVFCSLVLKLLIIFWMGFSISCSYKSNPVLLEPTFESGKASFYGDPNGKTNAKTASGEIFNPNEKTAAHRTLPFGTMVKVENVSNNKSVVVRVNDRGPFIKGRIIDVSYAAASELGMVNSGMASVRVTPLK